jgi:RNA polymerase sigma-70 factor (ECF subfamily)
MGDKRDTSALTSAELLASHQAGDSVATNELFHRYVEKLMRIARRRLAPKLAGRVDPEDIVQSAYRSFFTAAGQGRFVLERSGDLWRLLVGITLNKLYRQVEQHTAQKRDVTKECRLSSGTDGELQTAAALSREPSPSDVAGLADEIELVMRQLEPVHREMFQLRLQGYLVEEIAERTNRTQRTVLRVLNRVKEILSERASRAGTD